MGGDSGVYLSNAQIIPFKNKSADGAVNNEGDRRKKYFFSDFYFFRNGRLYF